MTLGIGTDIVKVARIARLLERHPEFIHKVFTASEIEYCNSRSFPAQSYAARFAAKEAVMKALGTGWDGQVNWRDIEVLNTGEGVPKLKLHGLALERMKALGAENALLSLSHEKEFAVAFVVLTGKA
ncbi:MAG: holo-ACP synthase [Candidatus Cloacimonadaceae bacterium]|jgi:holo-[acyl-carrier protein] synthase|nr:holo-ACP synthase [Candidatus Cloacimonadota bacterium]MDX9949072.1 holo-ACP synthase [Candidatus Syntrophosphaera sp.]NLN84745.1 holo-ACP synthase [Candidatus Cloacimonadota bacterium]